MPGGSGELTPQPGLFLLLGNSGEAEGVGQWAEYLPSMLRAPGLIPSTQHTHEYAYTARTHLSVRVHTCAHMHACVWSQAPPAAPLPLSRL